MRNHTLMQTRTAVIGIVAGFVLGASGAATAATHHHASTSRNTVCQLDYTTKSALRTIAASATPNHTGVNVSSPALQADAALAQRTLDAAGC